MKVKEIYFQQTKKRICLQQTCTIRSAKISSSGLWGIKSEGSLDLKEEIEK